MHSYVLFYIFILLGILSCSDPKKPENNRFSQIVVVDNLDEPMQFEILNDGRILLVERKGKIKVFDPILNQSSIIADIPVSIGYYSISGEELSSTGEDGLHGAILDPKFEENNWIYVFYSPKGGDHRSILSRFEWIGDSLNMKSEKVLLEIPNQRISCCHLGGGMTFDAEGNLFISTGDNTPNDPRGYTPIDGREGRSRFDAQRTSGNANDLRGKILKIYPEPDASYSIPDGNLFPIGTPGTRPEIYTMGNRNPWRLSIDSKTGWIFWGEVGPAGVKDSIGFGPKSYDEFNVAKKPGNYGWPHFLADNKPYWNFDYSTNKVGKQFDPQNLINNSPNNTGIKNLPQARPALIWYPQTKSEEFPLMGSGSNSAVGGPILRRSNLNNPRRPFPEYYEGKWFITDWTRGWIMLISLDNDGDFVSMEQFLPELQLNGPIDMKFGLDGDLYILEYGRGPYKLNPEARLIRLEFNSGNRNPIPSMSADKVAGAAPLIVNFSSEGTIDYDNDSLDFEWSIKSNNQTLHVLKESNPQFTFEAPGNYLINLKVTDSHAGEAIESMRIIVGNDPPIVNWVLENQNKSFYFLGDTINFAVNVVDKEDGSLKENEIQSSQVLVNIEQTNYGEEGFKEILDPLKNLPAHVPFQSAVAANIINSSDCKSCHSGIEELIGPSYKQISDKYHDNQEDKKYLIDKIMKGGNGVWDAKMAMPAHPDLNEVQAGYLVEYIFSLKGNKEQKHFPLSGEFLIQLPDDESTKIKLGFGSSNSRKYLFRASYLDNGTETAPPILVTDIVILRNPIIPVIYSDIFYEIELNHQITISRSSVIPKISGSFIAFKKVDLTGIKEVKLDLTVLPESSGTHFGCVEIRVNSPEGDLIGELPLIKDKPGHLLIANNVNIKKKIGFYDLYFKFIENYDHSEINQIELRSIEFIK